MRGCTLSWASQELAFEASGVLGYTGDVLQDNFHGYPDSGALLLTGTGDDAWTVRLDGETDRFCANLEIDGQPTWPYCGSWLQWQP